MSTLEELEDLDRRDDDKKDKKGGDDKDKKKPSGDGDAEMEDAEPEEDDVLDEEILNLSTADVQTRKRLLENDSRIMRSEFQRLSHEKSTMLEKIKENLDKIANNRFVHPPPASGPWTSYVFLANLNHLQTASVPRRQRGGTPRSRPHGRVIRRRREYRFRRDAGGQVSGHQDVN